MVLLRIYLFRYKFSIIIAVIIALLSLIPAETMPDTSMFEIMALDKIAHFSLYALFGFTALLESRWQLSSFQSRLLLLFSIFVLSTLIEVLQATVVETRSAEWLDLAANFSGLVAGSFAFRLLRYIRF